MYLTLEIIFYSLLTVVIFLLSVYCVKIKYGTKQNLCGKYALVTGGSNGLGQQICYQLASKGCNIAIADICSADETVEKLRIFDVIVKAYKVDVSSYKEILDLSSKLEDFGKIDILVNNAGLIPYKTIFEQSYEEIERLTRVNINSVIFMTKCFLDGMVKRGHGHIVTISSVQGIYPFSHSVSYCSTKFAVTGFMLALKEYLRQEKMKNVFTTTILPMPIATNQDVISAINPSNATLLSSVECAKEIVEAIINRSSFVTLPFYMGISVAFFNLLPFWLQHLVRDIRNEKSYLNKLQ